MDEQLSDKLKSILSDPDSLNSILSMASALGLGASANKNEDYDEKKTDDTTPEDAVASNAIKPTAALSLPVPKIQNTDDRVNLLLSIKPFLSERKRKKVDSIVKALGAAKIISAYKDIDILSKLGL